MLIEKYNEEILNGVIPIDSPPSYDQLDPRTLGSTSSSHPPEKQAHGPSEASSSSPRSLGSVGGGPATASSSWFNFRRPTRIEAQVRTTVLGLVRDLVRQQQHPRSMDILKSCAEACSANGISFPTLLQEKSIEEHTPLYWAIVKRAPESGGEGLEDDGPDLLTSLLSFSAPLTQATISDIRHACLLTSDQLLFQRLRLSPEFSPLSGTDAMILHDYNDAHDTVEVRNLTGDEGAFAVDFCLVQFQKRMRISRNVMIEFIARGRMWRLAFTIGPEENKRRHYHTEMRPGSWYIVLSLHDNSPPTWVDSRLLIPEPSLIPLAPTPPVSLIDAPYPPEPVRPKHKTHPKQPISLRIRSVNDQLISLTTKSRSSPDRSEIVLNLDDSPMGSTLQYAGCSYIARDGTLSARLEARLTKPEAECVIC